MQKSNVNHCPHKDAHAHTIQTSDGRTAVLCPACMAALENRLADHVMIRGMMKSTMTGPEVAKMRYERENMRLEKELADTVVAAFAVAGYPRRLALAAPVVL